MKLREGQQTDNRRIRSLRSDNKTIKNRVSFRSVSTTIYALVCVIIILLGVGNYVALSGGRGETAGSRADDSGGTGATNDPRGLLANKPNPSEVSGELNVRRGGAPSRTQDRKTLDEKWKSDPSLDEEKLERIRGHTSKNNNGDNSGGAGGDDKYQIVFSTDCSPYQHWQAYVLFYSALKVGQRGYVTRIASGCSEEEGKAELDWHNRHIRGAMSERFKIHLTPHFSSVVEKDGEVVGNYEFFNKPFGMRHWMENGEGMGINPKSGKMRDEDAIIVLLDPDHILLRPFTDDFSDDKETIVNGIHKENRKTRVEHGSPFGQFYGLGSKWREFNLAEITSDRESPAKQVPNHEAQRDYPAGPPYLATARDMYHIVTKWAEFVPKVHNEYPFLLAEMYAYCIAAAHVKLPHQIVHSMMVSNTQMGNNEGWDFLDKIPAENICEYASALDHKKHALPNVLHHCQRYMLGKHFFGKRRLAKDFFTCESPMLVEIPGDIALRYDYQSPPPPHKPSGEKKPVKDYVVKREAFMLCAITAAMNEASDFFKRHACEGVERTSYEKSLDLWHM